MRALVLLCASAAIAEAAPPLTAIEIDREDAPAGRAELGFDGGAPLDGWGASLGAGLLRKPLTVDFNGVSATPVYCAVSPFVYVTVNRSADESEYSPAMESVS